MHPQTQNDAAGIITTTEELLDNTGAFADTVSIHAKVLLVPGRSGRMSLLHCRFGAKSIIMFHKSFKPFSSIILAL